MMAFLSEMRHSPHGPTWTWLFVTLPLAWAIFFPFLFYLGTWVRISCRQGWGCVLSAAAESRTSEGVLLAVLAPSPPLFAGILMFQGLSVCRCWTLTLTLNLDLAP